MCCDVRLTLIMLVARKGANVEAAQQKLSFWQVSSAVPLSGVSTCAIWMHLSHWYFDIEQLSPERATR